MREILSKIHSKLGSFMFSGRTLGMVTALVLASLPLLLIGVSWELGKQHGPAAITVMITNFGKTSGGTGVVIGTSTNRSLILTNAHVCRLVEKIGGVVEHDLGAFFITGTQSSKQHDLCVVSVAADLKKSVEIAKNSPELFTEATVTGHPALLPTIISKGLFAEKQIISVMTEIRPCKEDDVKSEEDLMMCLFLGGFPVIKRYESQVVSALIQGGSSGSAVLNDKGELSGLVFAGSGEGLSYASIVPYQYIISFLYGEFEVTKMSTPNTEQIIQSPRRSEIKTSPVNMKDLRDKCRGVQKTKLKELCSILKRDTLFRGE